MTEIKKRIQVGIEYGVALAIVLILWAGGVWFISGGPGPEDNFPLSFSAIVVLYLLGGIAGGYRRRALSPPGQPQGCLYGRSTFLFSLRHHVSRFDCPD